MTEVIVSLKCDLDSLAELINILTPARAVEITNISIEPELLKPLPWKPLPRKPPAKTKRVATQPPHPDGAVGLLTDFIFNKGIGTEFALGEAQRLFKERGYNTHSASARLSECCQAGALELTSQGIYAVKALLTAQEVKQKRNHY